MQVDLDLGKVVIRRINISSKTLEAMLMTYKTCKSPRHENGTKLDDTKITNKQNEEGSVGHQTLRGVGP
jgi:hypothetical protein